MAKKGKLAHKKGKKIRIECSDCGCHFSYIKTANVVKKFCEKCCREHNTKSKHRNYINTRKESKGARQKKSRENEAFFSSPDKGSPVILSKFIDDLQRFATWKTYSS